MTRRPRQQRHTVYLLKQGTDRSSALRPRDDLSAFTLPVFAAEHPTLFVVGTPPRPPWWLSYFDHHASEDLPVGLFNASTAAVLLLEVEDRLFAFTFGHGRHLLDLERVEQDFGLKVVLNTVAPDQLKSVDTRTIDELTLHARRDVSRDASLSAFGLDVSRDMLRSVVGTPRDQSLGRRLVGSDSLALNTHRQAPELPGLCSRLLEDYHSTVYREHFDFIDFLRPVRDAVQIAELEQMLIDGLHRKEITDLHLAAPEVLDWLGISGFRFSTQPADAELDTDPRISSYLDSTIGPVDIDSLKRHHQLFAISSADGDIFRSWPVYRCLVYEVQLGETLYVLSAGEWYRVKVSYKERVYDDVAAIPDLGITLPAAAAEDREVDYNQRAALSAGLLCLDRALIQDGGPDQMEICDLLTPSGGFIHVKSRGSSSTLSHLFLQGINSAERLLQDREFRERARDRIAGLDPSFSELIPIRRPRPEDHEISFVVITRSDRPTRLTLPFFSLVSLRSAASRLSTLGFPVTVAKVQQARA